MTIHQRLQAPAFCPLHRKKTCLKLLAAYSPEIPQCACVFADELAPSIHAHIQQPCMALAEKGITIFAKLGANVRPGRSFRWQLYGLCFVLRYVVDGSAQLTPNNRIKRWKLPRKIEEPFTRCLPCLLWHADHPC